MSNLKNTIAMKVKITLLCLLMCCFFSSTALALTFSVHKTSALMIAQRQFQGRDVDYFILQDNNQTEWTIFVDAEPMKGWEHECYILTIPKTAKTSLDNVVPSSKIRRNLPPSDNFVPLLVKNRYGDNADPKLAVPKASQSNDAKTAAQRTYAIILSGGVNKMSNYERYWNDCSFIYQTLVNKYGVPKENIFPIMSDGTNPAEDMRRTVGGFKSQPLDLDNDGVADIKLAATKANIQSTLNTLRTKLKDDDHLFFYVIDHGGTTDYNTDSYICLWGNERLYDYQLAEMLTPFTQQNVNVNVVLGQCFSGGFNDNLTKVGCVVASASTGSESSWACSDIPYDEFVYQWTCAINGANHRGAKVYSDTDNNGRITMEEAFIYAKNHDRRSEEHPQYVSTPLSVGEDLAFNYLAPAVDLYVKDNPEDTGKEPNTTTDKFWLSPSIWIRNNADGICEHENPVYSANHTSATVYVRVHNRGKKQYDGGTQYVHVYWAKASTGFRPQAWMGQEVYTNGEVTGGPMTPSVIRKIPAGGYIDIPITWALPADLLGTSSDNGTEKHHFCLLAQISNTNLEPWYDGTFTYSTRNSNNDAQKNVSIISQKELNSGTSVFVRNIYDVNKKYSLELIPRTSSDEAIYSHATIEMELSQPIYTAWEQGGSQSNNIMYAPSISPRKVQFLSKGSRLESILLKGKEFDKVTLRFGFKKVPTISRNYTLDLIQRDEYGNIIGGETFIVKSPLPTYTPISIVQTPIINNGLILSTDAEENSQIRWENTDGVTISNENTLTLTSGSQVGTYYAYSINENGELAMGSITLDRQIGISNISVEDGSLIINLLDSALPNSTIAISSVVTGELISSNEVEIGGKRCMLDISTLPKGVYVVSYILDGEIVNSAKFTK